MARSKDMQTAADIAAVSTAAYFTSVWFFGRGRYERVEYATLLDARAAVATRGRDEYGRCGLVYAVTRTGMTIHVEDQWLRT